MKFKIDDTVKITSGKDKGKTGQITKIFVDRNRVTVKGINLFKRHLKPREGIEGSIVSIERPLPTANLAIICPTCKKPTRAGYHLPKKGKKIRICRKCSADLDKKTTEKKSKKTSKNNLKP